MVGGPGIGGLQSIWPHGKHKEIEMIRESIMAIMGFLTLVVNNKAFSYGLQSLRPFYTW